MLLARLRAAQVHRRVITIQNTLIPEDLHAGDISEPFFEHIETGKTLLVLCKNWSCSACGPERGKRIRRGVIKTCAELSLQYLYTFTAPSVLHEMPLQESRKIMSQLFNAWLSAVKARPATKKRKAREGICNYIQVPEAHDSGVVHLHVGTDFYMTSRRLAETWTRLGGGFTKSSWKNRRVYEGLRLVGSKPISSAATIGVGRYLSKYISKSVGDEQMPWDSFVCQTDGSHRKTPWHRWSANRFTAIQIRHHAGLAPRKKDPAKPSEWRLVRRNAFTGVPEPVFVAREPKKRVEACLGHLYGATSDCHGSSWAHRPPTQVKPPACGLRAWIAFNAIPTRAHKMVSVWASPDRVLNCSDLTWGEFAAKSIIILRNKRIATTTPLYTLDALR